MQNTSYVRIITNVGGQNLATDSSPSLACYIIFAIVFVDEFVGSESDGGELGGGFRSQKLIRIIYIF